MLASAASDIWVAVINTTPVLVAVTAAAVVALANRERLGDLLARATTIKVGPLELGLSVETLARARDDKQVTEEQVTALKRRVARNQAVLDDVRLLWVDDHPENNRAERESFRGLGLEVHTATDSREAKRLLDRDTFDVLLTDNNRDGDEGVGVDFVVRLGEQGLAPPAIGYVGRASRGTPPYFHAFVDRPDELLHAILDVLERK